MAETAYGRLGHRLRRILVMVPYIIQNPGVTVDELSRRFGVARRDIVADLHLVWMCGLPGYTPADLIDVTFAEDDRVYVGMADYFAAPLRLSPAEALSLYAGGAAVASLPGMEEVGALRRALDKLGRALGPGSADPGVQVELEPGPGEHLGTVQEALTNRRRVALDYYSASRGELTTREVDPWGLIAALGRWYVVGLDHLSGEERMFRVDRIKTASTTAVPASVPDDFNPEAYRGAFRGGRHGVDVTLELSARAAGWFEDYYPVADAVSLADGWRRVKLASSRIAWAAGLVLRLGGDVRNVAPAAVVDEARSLARRIAARHAPAL